MVKITTLILVILFHGQGAILNGLPMLSAESFRHVQKWLWSETIHKGICISWADGDKTSSTLSGFSFDSKSAVPDSYFWAGTPTFHENLAKLHSGTPTFLKKCPWDSCFENPSENPVHCR